MNPLAELMRPKNLKDVLGQGHLIGTGKILTQIIESQKPLNLIFWGPPGSGKTTLARAIAADLNNTEMIELSAVSANKKDITEAAKTAEINQNLGQKTILFIDEIHRFNKAQQDTLLPYVESGRLIFIGATTENPSFEIITPLISRSRVVVLRAHKPEDILKILKRAQAKLKAKFSIGALSLIARASDGDARVALGSMEALDALNQPGSMTIKKVDQFLASIRAGQTYDRLGDQHYDTISAFIKSMRASDGEAARYYMARMLAGGEDPVFIARRMVIFASEDIGLAGNGALSLAVATLEACRNVGLPECRYALYHACEALSRSKKSREIADKLKSSEALAAKYPNAPIPMHLRNAPTKLMKELGYGNQTSKKEGNLPDNIRS
jgi:putative ATPase